jgi:hypothetical protein
MAFLTLIAVLISYSSVLSPIGKHSLHKIYIL